MGFGSDFQGQDSHDALVQIQDTEIRLLENMKTCLAKRIEADRKYISNLSSFVQVGNKIEETEYHGYCSVFKAWSTVTKGTEQFVELLQGSLDTLNGKLLEKINSLINEKKSSKKLYEEERNRMEKEFTRLKDEVQKNKQEYSKCMDKMQLEKIKYETLNAKGKTTKGNKLDSVKQSYVNLNIKLHKAHNRYIMSLCEVTSFQDNYHNTTLPYFLDHHQASQEILVQQCKDFLTEFQSRTSFGSAKHLAIYESVEKAVGEIIPEKEYTETFLEKHKSDPFKPIVFEFDSKVLDSYQGHLEGNKIALDDFTHEMLIHSKASLTDEIEAMKRSVDKMEREKTDSSERVAELRRELSSLSDEEYSEYLEKRKKFEELKKYIAEVGSNIRTKSDVLKLIDDKLTSLGENNPPAAMDLDISNDCLSTNSTEENRPNSRLSRLKLMGINPFKKIRGKENGRREEAESYEDQDNIEDGVHETDPNPGSTVRKLEDEDWFHGVLPREEVQRLLVNDGDFLVRESKNKRTNETQYVLSAYWQGYRHFIIQFQEGGWRFEGNMFPTIPELVNYQYKSGIPVTNKSGTILKTPVVRESWELRNDDIALETKIGNGNFGEVFRGIFKKTGEVVAVKTCRDTLSEDQRKKFLMEGRILKQYDHPNIVKFIGIAAQRQPVMIIMEYVAGGALLSFLRKEGKKQSRQKAAQMCVDAACGMEYLSDKGCIHRDLAARNCLVGDSNVVKISDFGMSREEEEYTVSDGMKQIPIKWTAPEALNYGRYTTACDVWSYGILMWEIFSNGQTPYPGWTNAIARDSVEKGYRMPAPSGTPDSIYKLMERCWDQNPQTRINFQQLHVELEALVTKSPKGENWG